MARKKSNKNADRKLLIWAFKDDNFSMQVKGLQQPLEVSINPDSYQRAHIPLKSEKKTQLASGEFAEYVIVDPPPEEFSMELWFDGTGAIPGTRDVTEEIDLFKKFALLYNGNIHSTNFVKLQWGGKLGLTFKGQLKSFSVEYTLFDRTGKPLRAKGKASFVEVMNAKTRESLKGKNSSDLTHVRIARAGDNLPLMCYDIYGDASYYPQVARVNALETLMVLEPGQRIVFPPLKN